MTNLYTLLMRDNRGIEFDEAILEELDGARGYLMRRAADGSLDSESRDSAMMAIGQLDVAKAATESAVQAIIAIDCDESAIRDDD